MLPCLLQWENVLNRGVGMQQVLVAFLTAMLKGGVEPKLKSTVKQMGTIAKELGGVALPSQRGCDMVATRKVDGLPTVVRPT